MDIKLSENSKYYIDIINMMVSNMHDIENEIIKRAIYKNYNNEEGLTEIIGLLTSAITRKTEWEKIEEIGYEIDTETLNKIKAVSEKYVKNKGV